MNRLLFLLLAFTASTFAFAGKPKVVAVTAEPKEAAIYLNNEFGGYGYAEFTHPKKNQVIVIRIECPEYKTVNSKYYGDDNREAVSFKLQQDGFYRASAASGIVNKYFTIDIDPMYYSIEDEKVNVEAAWKLLHQILLNYFDEIGSTDIYGGYVQTPWKYKSFPLSEHQIRNRVTIRDISTPKKVAFQIKVSSETAGAMAAKHGEFTEVDRIPKDLEPILEELQTRIGKVSSL